MYDQKSKTMSEKTSKTNRDMEKSYCKHPQEETHWSDKASEELLRLRFRQLRDQFDNAKTVADVHETWGVVASLLSSKSEWGVQVNAVDCSDQLTKLRQQWQEKSTVQLHVMMDECFSKSIVEVSHSHQSFEQALPLLLVRNNCNRVMDEALVQEAETAEAVSKRCKSVIEKTVPPSDATTPYETFASVERAMTLSPELTSRITRDDDKSLSTGSLHEDRLLPAPDPTSVSFRPVSATRQDMPLIVAPVEEEMDRHGEIMRALEQRSQYLARLAQSHKHLADVTQQLMEVLVNRNIK